MLVPPSPVAREAVTAYLWTPETEGAYRMAFRLLQEGYHLATATEPLRAGGRDYPRGTLLARVERNPASCTSASTTLATEFGVPVTTADTAYVDQGNVGPGSEEVVSLKVPKVALIAGDEAAQTSYAEISYLLGKDMGVEFVPMSVEAFKNTRMADFNVLILPDGSAKRYAEAFDKEGVEKLKDWCKDGGTLICVGGAAGFAADKKVDLTGSRVVGADTLAKQDDDTTTTRTRTRRSAAGKPPADKDKKPEGKKAAPSSKATDPDKNKKDEPHPDDGAATPTPGPTRRRTKPPRPNRTQEEGVRPAQDPAGGAGRDLPRHGEPRPFPDLRLRARHPAGAGGHGPVPHADQARRERADLPGRAGGQRQAAVVAAGRVSSGRTTRND